MIFDKIIVIDDDPKVIKAVQMIFHEYQIIGFQDGKEAVEYLRNPHEINIVLIDVYIKETNGIDLLTEIKKIQKDISVIIMTAFSSKDVVLEALRGHADDFIEKPFDVSDLRIKVKNIIKEKSYYRNLDKTNRIERIKKFIEKNYDNISLEHIADEMCLSPKYVSRLFKDKNINGFRDYKVNIKIEKAKSLLANSTYTVSQIAEKLGYQNSESFMRIFKRITKYTPTQYRQKFKNKLYDFRGET